MNEQSLKEKLRIISNESGKTFQEVWKKLVLERFLARLSKSTQSDKLIFKGGLLLSCYLEIGRETKDIDFLLSHFKAGEDQIKALIKEVSDINTRDGFSFSFNKINQLDQVHMNYPGYRIKVGVFFGGMKDSLQIDIGVGDKVDSKTFLIKPIKYRGALLFEGEVSLRVYPVETIFAEKLESLMYRGAANSRMKDYHDLLLLSRSEILNTDKLKQQIIETFDHRSTELRFPIQSSNEDVEKLQTLWKLHLSNVSNHKELNIPGEISEVILMLNKYIEENSIL